MINFVKLSRDGWKDDESRARLRALPCICDGNPVSFSFGPDKACPCHGDVQLFADLLIRTSAFLRALESDATTPMHLAADISQFRGERLEDWD